MPIKKSELERKRAYRAAKTLLIVLPFIVVILFLLNRTAPICTIAPKGLLEAMIPLAIFIVAYFLVLIAVYRIAIYTMFGGLENDSRTDSPAVAQTGNPRRNTLAQTLPLVIILVVFAIIAAAQMGYLKIPGLMDQNGHWNVTPVPKPKCPATSAQTATPCHSVKGGVGVGSVIVHDYCACPSDTTYSGTTDVVTPGGPYKICTCK
jgi:hypothetical protein